MRLLSDVRVVGESLGLPHAMVYRQPFPGPGLGVRCLGAIIRAVNTKDAMTATVEEIPTQSLIK